MQKIATVKVPKTAYNPRRRMSSLLRSQVQLLQTAVLEAIDSDKETEHCIRTLTELLQDLRPHRGHVKQIQASVLDAIDTEEEAALCIKTYTRLLKDLRPKTEPRAYSARRRRTSKVKTRKRATRKAPAKYRRRAGARKR